ncbi:MAG: hypothetical protein JSV79_02905 [Armatimonadota bacterium]|nr:MAG: hypothetical protein JSV79_02905 [Armatimonadota bacterium]
MKRTVCRWLTVCFDWLERAGRLLCLLLAVLLMVLLLKVFVFDNRGKFGPPMGWYTSGSGVPGGGE